MKHSRNILVAPMNWGLGHATRCIPIINELLQNDFNPIIASDGESLELLQTEFPQLTCLELPSYEIVYARNPAFFNIQMIRNMPRIIEAVRNERNITKQWVKEYKLAGIISDNRFGVYSKKIPSVFMTHQLNVLAGKASWFTGKLHRIIIRKFTECWVPDYPRSPTLTGKLGHVRDPAFRVKYLGPLSRLKKEHLPLRYDLMVLLSGPEPQRSIFEQIVRNELQYYDGRVLLVRGKVEGLYSCFTTGNITECNFLGSRELQKALNESALILTRSGYTTIMDLAYLQKKAYFVPTPGQPEQEYLASRFAKLRNVPMCRQSRFSISNLKTAAQYSGLPEVRESVHWKQLFCLFERE